MSVDLVSSASALLTETRSRRATRSLLTFVVVAALLAGVAFWGRWTTTYDFFSHGLASTNGTGTESSGGEGPFELSGRAARVSWHLNHGVERVTLQVVPIDAPAPSFFAPDPDSRLAGGVEFTTSDRDGSRSLSALPTGRYRLYYLWSTRGAETGEWSLAIEQRLPWWR